MNKKTSNNMVNAKTRIREDGPVPDYQDKVDPREFDVEITIKQRSPRGEVVDVMTFYMSPTRVNSWNVKDGKVMIMTDKNRPKRIGAYRACVLLSKKICSYGSFSH